MFVCVMTAVLAGVSMKAYAQNNFTVPGDSDNLELLMKAASTGDLATIQSLAGQDSSLVKARSSKDGKTALHIACINAKYDAVKLLLNYGADPNARDYYCKTPYYYARVGYNPSICKLLTSRGAMREYVRFFPHCCTQMSPNPARHPAPRRCSP
jgi:ankyrin repeat protein